MSTYPVCANAWERTPTVDFRGTGISETIQVRPTTNPNPVPVADAHHAIALEIRAGASMRGDRVVLRPWFNVDWGDQPRAYNAPNDRTDPNAWPQVHAPFVHTTLPAYLTAWHDGYNARTIANGTFPDALTLDNEIRREFYYFATQEQRQAYFEDVTAPDFVVPGLSVNPWIGQNIWQYGQPFTDSFIQYWSQWCADDLSFGDGTGGLVQLHSGIWSGDQVEELAASKAERFGTTPDDPNLNPRPISNYRDAAYTFTWGESFNRPGRLPYASTRMAQVSAPVCYFNRRDLPLFAAEPGYTTTRQIANRQRWKSILFNLSEVRSCAGTPLGDIHPWVQSPGWGWNGGEGWALVDQLPFELILWRAFMSHLDAMGICEYQLWNPIPPENNPTANDRNAATTHRFMAEWFRGRRVGPLVRNLPAIDIASDSFRTGTAKTSYNDLFEMRTMFVRRASRVLPVPYLQGWPWSATDPLIVSWGPDGSREIADMKAAIEATYGVSVVVKDITNRGSSRMIFRRMNRGTAWFR